MRLLVLVAVAGWATLLGLAVEAVAVGLAATLGGAPSRAVLGEVLGFVGWSVAICVALAAAELAIPRLARLRLVGFVAAPVALAVGRVVYDAVGDALDLPLSAGTIPFVVLALVKSAEYGALLWLLDARRQSSRVAHVGIGAGLGALAAVVILPLLAASGAPASAIVSRAALEIVFPAGCALVVHSVARVERAARLDPNSSPA